MSRLSVNLSLPTDSCEVEPMSNHNLLLNNIQKVEGICYIYNHIFIILYSNLLFCFLRIYFKLYFILFYLITLIFVGDNNLRDNSLSLLYIRFAITIHLCLFYCDKIGIRDMASARDIVSSIISAANKKIQRRRKNQDEIDEHEGDKVSC